VEISLDLPPKCYLFETRPYNGRRGCWIAPHLWLIVDNQLKTECWYCAGCGNSPIAGAATGLQYWLCSGPKWPVLAITMCSTSCRLYLFVDYAQTFSFSRQSWYQDVQMRISLSTPIAFELVTLEKLFFPYCMWHIFSKAFNTLQIAVNFYVRARQRGLTSHAISWTVSLSKQPRWITVSHLFIVKQNLQTNQWFINCQAIQYRCQR